MNTTASTSPADMEQLHVWTARYFASAKQLPVAFNLGGKAIAGFPDRWQATTRRQRIEANLVETVYEGTDPVTGLRLRVEVTEYQDYPVVEWVAWLTNMGTAPTPIISDLRALDATFAGDAPVLYHCNGDYCSAEGYTPEHTPLAPGDTLSFAPQGGHPCDGAWPYFRLLFPPGGMTLAIGWPAQWSAAFTATAEGVAVSAGQEHTSLRLEPGETIRTPRMMVMAWTGAEARAVNLWRRWYRDHVLPRPDGQPLGGKGGASGTDRSQQEYTGATEENQLSYMAKWAEHGLAFDLWWIDAGWYPCYNERHERRYLMWGTWQPDPERFPRGLKPIADAAAAHGAQLLAWFIPEYVREGTEIHREHPEWLWDFHAGEWVQEWITNQTARRDYYLSFGNPAARQWLTDRVCQLIRDEGIGIYRQDGGWDIAACWRAHETEDRQGLNENRHVQGYPQYWDDLLARNPGLWIDSCASGGRRNDLETLRRSVPLHATDYGYGDHPIKLAFQHTLYEWLPYFKETTLSWDLDGSGPDGLDRRLDPYSWHCGLAAMLTPSVDPTREDLDYDLMRRLLAWWRRAAKLVLNGDYYPLTPPHRSPEQWVARQFDWPEQGTGFLQAIRLPAVPEATLTVSAQGLDPAATYLFENPETGATRSCTGRDAAEGFTFELEPRSGELWFYRAQTP